MLDVLDEAIAARIVSDVPGGRGRLRFAHVLIRDTLYEGLTAARRMRLHKQAVESLEALYGDEPGSHLAELAHHSIAGRDFAKGCLYAQRAGDRALALFAYEEAARLYQTALEALDLTDEPKEPVRAELLLSLGEAEVRAGNSPAAKHAFLTAAEIARQNGLPRALGRAAVGYGGRIVWARAGDDNSARPPPRGGSGRPWRGRRRASRPAPRPPRGCSSRRALPRSARRTQPRGVELARRTRNSGRPQLRARRPRSRDLRPRRASRGPRDWERATRAGRADRRLRTGRTRRIFTGSGPTRAREHRRGSGRSRRGRQNRRGVATTCSALAGRLRAGDARSGRGRLRRAETLVHNALALGEGAQPESAIPVYRLQRYTLADFRGNLEEIEPGIIDLVAAYPARPSFVVSSRISDSRLGRLGRAKQNSRSGSR